MDDIDASPPAPAVKYSPAAALLCGVLLAFATMVADQWFARRQAVVEVDPGSDSAWTGWAEQQGSAQLRDAIQAGVDEERLYDRDIARAITPELAGTTRCPDAVSYDSRIEVEYDAARNTFVRARTVIEEASRQFPVGSSVLVRPPVGCWLPGGAASGTCIPVSLVRGEYLVQACYLVDKTVGK